MKKGRLTGFGCAICAIVAVIDPARAQDPSPPPAAYRWQIDYGEYRCRLSRRFGDTAPVDLVIRMDPGLETADLIVVNPAWPSASALPSRVRVVLSPSGSSFEAAAQSAPVPSSQHRFMRVLEIGREFFESFSGSNRLMIEGDGRELLSLDLAQTTQAARALRTCQEQLIRGWGIDTVAAASVTRRPIPLGQTALFMRSVDPITGPDASQSSFLVIRYTVAINGRITNCEVVRESGGTGHGPAVCSRARQDARFEPAIGADNQPVPFQLVQTVALVRRP